ncbi:hypothetical protein EGW08_010838, partial [Elysia chlorotica]
KRERQKEEEYEKSSFIFEERKKTIERLKEYKVKYTAPKAIKPPRYQKPSEKVGAQSKSANGKSKETTKGNQPQRNVPRKSKYHPKQAAADDASNNRDDIPVTIFVNDKQTVPGNKARSPDVETGLPVPSAPPPPPPPPSVLPLPPPQLPSKSTSSQPSRGNLLAELSQGQSVLKKVDHTSAKKDSSGGPGPIDLGSILASRSKLKPASARQDRPPLAERADPLEDIFSMIRSGVTLRKVVNETSGEGNLGDPLISSTSSSVYSMDARSQLHNTLLNKICRGVRGNSPESDDEFGSENDDFEDD